MSAFVNDLVGALQSEEDNTFIFDWLAQCLQAEWTTSSTPNERTWSPVRATHRFTVGTDGLGRRHLAYSADVFRSPARPFALQLVDSLNRRAPGGAFVVVNDGSSSLVRAHARCDLSLQRWYVPTTFSSTVQVLIGIVEHIIVRPDIWNVFDCTPCVSDSSTPMFDIPYTVSRVVNDDPHSPRFAVPEWISEQEQDQFHATMRLMLNEYTQTNSDSYRTFGSSDENVIPIHRQLESNYPIGTPGGDENPYRGYDVAVTHHTVRHPELGWGIERLIRFPYFLGDSPSEESKDTHVIPAAVELANSLNCAAFGLEAQTHLLSETPPTLCVGSWTAHGDQLYHTTFFRNTDLAPVIANATANVGKALAALFDPMDAFFLSDLLVEYATKKNAYSAREPINGHDLWGGCSRPGNVFPLFFPSPMAGPDPVNIAHQLGAPVIAQWACWGMWTIPGVTLATLEIVVNPYDATIHLVARHRTVQGTSARGIHSIASNGDTKELTSAAIDYLSNLGWDFFDWFLITDLNVEEEMKNALAHFIAKIDGERDLYEIASAIHGASDPWMLVEQGRRAENVFLPEKPATECYEWVITRPDIIESRLAHMDGFFQAETALASGSSTDEIMQMRIKFYFDIAVRRQQIDSGMSLPDYAREVLEIDEEILQQLFDDNVAK